MLWMDLNKPEEGIDKASQSVLENGSRVGDAAMAYFGDYKEVPFSYDKKEMCDVTDALLKENTPVICEASFLYDDCFCSADILRKMPDGFELIEVKSSTGVHDIYVEDLAYQYYVLTNCKIPVVRAYVMYINNQYVRNGALDLQQLFALKELTEECKDRLETVKKIIGDTKTYLAQTEEPARDIGLYCETPYDCAYMEYCRALKGIPSPSVFDIGRMSAAKKYQYYKDGIITYDDLIHKKVKLNANQLLQVNEYRNQSPAHIEKEPIKQFLNTLTYPLYYLDFETFQQAIPEIDGIRPYEQIPFQYSLHVQRSEGAEPEHYEFLAKEGEDPRRKIAESLVKDIPTDVCLLAYNSSVERGIIERLAGTFPDLHDHLTEVSKNIKDLAVPFSKKYYYTKEMGGNYSIKVVLPALCSGDPELDYHALDGIHNGGEAMSAFPDLVNHTPEEIEVIRNQLLAYCKLDTLAMVKVLAKLYQAVSET